MQIKIDESVLRKTEVFSKVLEDANRRNDIAPDLACGIRKEYGNPIPNEDKDAIDNLSGLGVCLRGDHVIKHTSDKTPDIITGGFLKGTTNEIVYIVECKFNAENPGNTLGKLSDFRYLVADKFHVVNRWNIYAQGKKFFVLFPHKNAELAKRRMRALQKASERDELKIVKSFTVCNLTEFRDYFA